jgi:TolB protein
MLAYSFARVPDSKDYGIATIPVTGGEPTMLVERGVTPTWSPDGSAIAYVGVDDKGRAGVDVRRLDPASTVRVTSGHGAFGSWDFALPQWSPDGTELTYFSGPGVWDIWVAKADGSGDSVIIRSSEAGGMDTREQWPAWLPDGRHIAYHSTTHSPSGWVVAGHDGSDRLPIRGSLMIASYPTTVSPDGTRLVGFDQAKGVQLLDLSGQGDPIDVDVDSPFMSTSWQRLAP